MKCTGGILRKMKKIDKVEIENLDGRSRYHIVKDIGVI